MNNLENTLDLELDTDEQNNYISAVVGNTSYSTEPFIDIFYPITNYDEDAVVTADSIGNTINNEVVGVVAVTLFWRDILQDCPPGGIDGMHVVIENTCNQTFTYTWEESEFVYLGEGDLHESAYDAQQYSFELNEDETYSGLQSDANDCRYTIHTYPSTAMFESFRKTEPSPGYFAGIAITIFVFTSMVFICYDCLVERRQRKVYSSAVKNNAIVSSLFPKNVRDRLYKENSTHQKKQLQPTKVRLKSMIHDEHATTQENEADSPIADLFSNCTVLFADIQGFTSWSSERSPGQVFVLLENIYGAFDRIADRRGVFKVETIGDCYMAVTGLPNPQKDHAVIMARFARDCRDQLATLTRSLEVSLGPETSDLTMRFGLHSGPVTAGVLRGQKSRFQLFGDTVNTASRMESTGVSNQIHISEETARLLSEAGKSNWLTPRSDKIKAKGKGELSTYWLFDKDKTMSRRGSTCASTISSETTFGTAGTMLPNTNSVVKTLVMNDRRGRLIDWNVDLFAGMIRKIVARREAQKIIHKSTKGRERFVQIGDEISIASNNTQGMVLDEVVEIIELPAFDPKVIALQEDPHSIYLGAEVMAELREYIYAISIKYKRNGESNDFMRKFSSLFHVRISCSTSFFLSQHSTTLSMLLMLQCRWQSCSLALLLRTWMSLPLTAVLPCMITRMESLAIH